MCVGEWGGHCDTCVLGGGGHDDMCVLLGAGVVMVICVCWECGGHGDVCVGGGVIMVICGWAVVIVVMVMCAC